MEPVMEGSSRGCLDFRNKKKSHGIYGKKKCMFTNILMKKFVLSYSITKQVDDGLFPKKEHAIK